MIGPITPDEVLSAYSTLCQTATEETIKKITESDGRSEALQTAFSQHRMIRYGNLKETEKYRLKQALEVVHLSSMATGAGTALNRRVAVRKAKEYDFRELLPADITDAPDPLEGKPQT